MEIPGNALPLLSRVQAYRKPGDTVHRWRVLVVLGTLAVALAIIVAGPVSTHLRELLTSHLSSGEIVGLVVGYLWIAAIVAVLPMSPVVVTAALVLGPVTGFLVSWVGIVLGGLSTYALGANIGPKGLALLELTKQSSQLRTALDRSDGQIAALALYFSMLVSFDAISYSLGAIRTRAVRAVPLLIIGPIPKLVFLSSLGAAVQTPWKNPSLVIVSFLMLGVAAYSGRHAWKQGSTSPING